MTITLNRPAPYPVGEAASGPPVLDVVIPVYNEQNDLEPCVRQLHAHLAGTFPYPFRITIADNASTDGTLALAETLQAALAEVRAVHLPEKGRGRALRAVWLASDAPVLAAQDSPTNRSSLADDPRHGVTERRLLRQRVRGHQAL